MCRIRNRYRAEKADRTLSTCRAVAFRRCRQRFVSVASLWEIAIKTRLGKLQPGLPLETGLTILPVDVPHVITAANPEPEARYPCDRLLLAQCKVEGLQLATVDRLLVGHPLALRL
ncbi:PilT domain-containing protein [Rhizobium etli]|uniref:PilT domain-containing protein n=1 Tax=Rhizobium etli TaxID=29449 RepID=A0AAN1EKQ4_RHIET|nr:PilT domain-containing protein [Rhizobium etli]